MEIKFELLTDKVLKQYSVKNRKKYVGAMQLGLAQFMAKVKMDSIKEIIPNRTGIYHPYAGRRQQPTTPGKLTERTGRMIAGLKEGGAPMHQDRTWKGFGNRLVKTDPSIYQTLNGTIKASTKGNSIDHVGTYAIYVRFGSKALLKKPRGVPLATKQQIHLRYQWETGIRGQVRPYMAPAAQKNVQYMKQFIEFNTSKVLKEMNK